MDDGGGVEPDKEHRDAEHCFHDSGSLKQAAHPPPHRGQGGQRQTGQREAQCAGYPADDEQGVPGAIPQTAAICEDSG